MPTSFTLPTDSPIESLFARYYRTYAADDAIFTPQVRVETICGAFILDFVIETPTGYRVGIECDGKPYHDESRDEWRDGMILGHGHVDAIYRFRGADITYRMEDILWCLCSLEPEIFGERAKQRIAAVASDEIKGLVLTKEKDVYTTRYQEEEGFLRIEARRRIIPEHQRRFWRTAYEYAVAVKGGKLDDVMEAYRTRWLL